MNTNNKVGIFAAISSLLLSPDAAVAGNAPTTTTKAPPVFTLERNGVEMPFQIIKITKGKNKGQEYISFDTDDKSRLQGWLGDDFWKMVIPKINNRLLGLNNEARDEKTNQLNLDELKDYLIKFSARGETMVSLQEDLEEKLAEMDDFNPDDPTDAVAIISLMKDIKSIKADMAAKKRERKPKAEVAANGATAPEGVVATTAQS